MKSYLLKGIEDELWKEFKTACAFSDLTIRQFFVNKITDAVMDYSNFLKEIKEAQKKNKKGGKGK